MFNHRHIREALIRPALNEIDLWSESAEEIIIATMAQETLGGCYVRQVKGPAVGVTQVEPRTFQSLWDNYISKNKDLLEKILKSNQYVTPPPAEAMVWNLKLAVQITRIFYRALPDKLPSKNDIEGIWQLYKHKYNSMLGSATREQFMRNYHMFLGADWDTSDEPRSHIIVSSKPIESIKLKGE